MKCYFARKKYIFRCGWLLTFRLCCPFAGLKLESEFPVQDLKSGQGGLLQVCMEGIGLLFANTKVRLFPSI